MDLIITLSILEDYFPNEKETRKRYYLQYFPERKDIYMNTIHICPKLVQELAFKHKMVNSLDEAIEDVKKIHARAKEDGLRIDVLFGAIDLKQNEVSEYRHDCDGRIILGKTSCAYNRNITEEERDTVYKSLLELYKE